MMCVLLFVKGTPEGVFCSGGGVKPDGVTPVAKFLGVFAEDGPADGASDGNPTWTGHLTAYNNTKPFADTFQLRVPGGGSNYTGVSQALGPKSFVWRGYMSGVSCEYAPKCSLMCAGTKLFDAWEQKCQHE